MTTKAQEREALKKIQQIIESMGKDSYLAITFDGIIEQAEENITNDFGSNYKESYEKVLDRIRQMQQIENENNKTIEYLSDRERQQGNTIKDLQAQRDTWIKAYNEVQTKNNDLETENEKLKAEIITLKAKLYDLITK